MALGGEIQADGGPGAWCLPAGCSAQPLCVCQPVFEGSPHHQEMERSLWNYFSKLHLRGPSPPVQCQSAEFTASLCHHLILWLVPYPCTQSPGDNGRPSGHRIMVRNTRAAMWYREPRLAHVKACAGPWAFVSAPPACTWG